MTIQLTEARIAEMLEALVQVVYRVGLLQIQWSESYAPHQYAPESKAAATAKVAKLKGNGAPEFGRGLHSPRQLTISWRSSGRWILSDYYQSHH